jgi:hypothetical protein
MAVGKRIEGTGVDGDVRFVFHARIRKN